MKRVLLILVVALALFGCGDPAPKEGFVREKKYEPAHWEDGYRTEYRYEYRCHPGYRIGPDGRSVYTTDCGIESVPYSVYEEHHRWINDQWRLRIEDCKENDKGEMKCRDGWVSVDHDTYVDFRIGRHYPDNTIG